MSREDRGPADGTSSTEPREAGPDHARSVEFPRVSVCVPAYNERRNISNVLSFLRSECAIGSNIIQVIVEASGSTDGTQQIVRDFARDWPIVNLIDVGRRDGLVKSLNRMFEMAEGQVIVRMDADVSMARGTLPILTDRVSQPGVGIVGPRIVSSMAYGWFLRNHSVTQAEVHHLVSTHRPKSTNVQVFRNIGIRLPSESESEDNVLQYEAIQAGLNVAYESRAVAVVAPPAQPSELFSSRIRCIRTTRWFKTEFGQTPSTQDFRAVFPAILRGLRSGRVRPGGLSLLLAFEVLCQAAVVLSDLFYGRRRTSQWPQATSTKSPPWSRSMKRGDASQPDRADGTDAIE